MRVSVYKLEDGGLAVLVQSSPGKGRPPVMIGGVTLGNLTAKVLPVVKQLRKPKGEQTTFLPQ